MSGRDRGQAAVLVLVLATVLFVSMSAALVEVGGRVIDRTRAQTAPMQRRWARSSVDARPPRRWRDATVQRCCRSPVDQTTGG